MPPPAPTATIISADDGAPKPAGATTVLAFGKDYDLKAGGADVYGTTDQFRFAYRVLAGDFDVVVRLDGLAATDSWAKAGLMARESLAANARNVFAFATPSTNGYRLQTRTATGGSTTLSATGGAVTYPNTWLRLRRVGNTFTAYRGTTGTTWAQYAATTMTLPSNIYVGMAATSHNTTTATAARFRSFKVG
jgi:regulation of enolase protein 1 (concanavalin A-like superfamily)